MFALLNSCSLTWEVLAWTIVAHRMWTVFCTYSIIIIPLNESSYSKHRFPLFCLKQKMVLFTWARQKNIAKQITLDDAIFIPSIYLLLIISNTLLSKHEWSESPARPAKITEFSLVERAKKPMPSEKLVNISPYDVRIHQNRHSFFFADFPLIFGGHFDRRIIPYDMWRLHWIHN